MTDRFKFRVWSKEDCGYMESNDIFRLTHSGKLVFNNDSLNREPECNPKKYIFEQCTGLKDKDGKLIYEGDIVREISKKEPEWEEYITEVKWGKCGFNLYSDEDYDFEIIGNIHENKDLLK